MSGIHNSCGNNFRNFTENQLTKFLVI